MILNARNKLAQEETGRPINTLPDLAYAAFGSMGSSTVGYLMFACHFGFAVTHCIFIGISMAALLKEADGYSWFHNHGHYEVYVAFVCLWGVGIVLVLLICPILASQTATTRPDCGAQDSALSCKSPTRSRSSRTSAPPLSL
eukprot:2489039-Rhodomonas_salina.1